GSDLAAWRQTGFWVVAGTLLSLTPTVEVLGRAIVTPRAWAIEWLPFLGRLRVPSRLGLGAYVALAAMAGLALPAIADRTPTAPEPRLPAPRSAPVLRRAVEGGIAIALVALVYVQYARGYGGPAYLRGPLPAEYPIERAIDGASPLLEHLRRPGGALL